MQFYDSHSLAKPYPARFFKHLKSFIKDTGILKKEDKILISTSGGVDSMALALAIKTLGYEQGTLVYFHHQTREQNDEEQSLVQNLAKTIGYHFLTFKLNIRSSNFEARARQERYKILKKLGPKFDKILTAHHINDSIEWHLMSEFKSSSLKSSLGVPLVRGKFVRPFHAFSKSQILAFSLNVRLHYLEDATNLSLDFERNLMRKRLLEIKKYYPSLEKHFVSRQNQLAHTLNVSAFTKGQYQMVESKKGIHLYSRNLDFSDGYYLIEKIVKRLSLKNRGSLRSQILKLIKSVNSGKLGPLSFSGGVEVYSSFGHLFFKRVEVPLNVPRKMDWQRLGVNDFEKLINRYHRYPFWIELDESVSMETRKTIPEFDTRSRYIAPMKLLYKWENDPLLRNKPLNLRFIC